MLRGPQTSVLTQDGRNQAVWTSEGSLRGYRDAAGFSDLGEQAIFELLRDRVRGERILDLGVGAGRTALFLQPLSPDYTALDYAPAMVAACRERLPGVNVQVGDARDLSLFASGAFGLVTFSFNGIDAVDRAGRHQVLSGVERVLKSGGLFWFSTLNLAGAGRLLRPWKLEWPAREGPALRRALQTARMLARVPTRLLNFARLRPHFSRGPGWAIDTLSTHDYRLLVHYTSLERQLQELAEHGLTAEQVLDSSFGRPVGVGDDTSGVFWFQILARKGFVGRSLH